VSTGLVVCFSGSIGAGKSSITHLLADALQWPRAGFGDFVREHTRGRGGNPDSRQELQDAGQRLVESDPDGFCRAVLASGGFTPGQNMLLDGIRHLDIYRRVQRLTVPSATVLLHLSIDNAEAQRRVEARDGGTADLARARAHRVESELTESLPNAADRIVDARPSVGVIAGEVLTVLSEFGASAETVKQARARLA
jgi:thymidylate kinase